MTSVARITIKHNEWGEVHSTDGQSRIINTYQVGSDVVTTFISRERRWAIMVRTGLDSDVTATFKEVLKRVKELNNDSFQGILVQVIGGQPRYACYYRKVWPLGIIKKISNEQLSGDRVEAFLGKNRQVYEEIKVYALEGKVRLGLLREGSMECSPLEASDTCHEKGYIKAKKIMPEEVTQVWSTRKTHLSPFADRCKTEIFDSISAHFLS